MGIDDKAKNMIDDVTGKVKEKVGEMTDNADLEAEGERDQAKADIGKATENVKDAFKE